MQKHVDAARAPEKSRGAVGGAGKIVSEDQDAGQAGLEELPR